MSPELRMRLIERKAAIPIDARDLEKAQLNTNCYERTSVPLVPAQLNPYKRFFFLKNELRPI